MSHPAEPGAGSSHTRPTSHTHPKRDTRKILVHSLHANSVEEVHHDGMSTNTGRFQPGLLTALVKVAMIGTWRGRTFLDDNLELDDVAGFVPDEPTVPVQMPMTTMPGSEQPVAPPAAADTGHSVAA